MESLVFQKESAGPATHALVIGVGDYPYLPGGRSKKKFANPGGMGQLRSPPSSARAFARWLIEEYHHPSKPLKSLSVLLSDPGSNTFEFTEGKTSRSVAVPAATASECQRAVTEWHERGNRDPAHLLIFYFCGHGIAALPDLALLLSDFGEKPSAALDGAIDFRRLRQNMEECAAREQCYFVDACREGSDVIIKNSGFAGQPIIHASGAFNGTGLQRQAPVFYSTLAGSPAYGQPGQMSLFTEALLRGLRGAGCSDEQGPWRVQTTFLLHALNRLMNDTSQRLSMPQEQITPADDLSLIELNVVDQPVVPVVVSCSPESANRKAILTYRNGKKSQQRGPAAEAWRLQLLVGDYDFEAKFTSSGFKGAKRPKFPVRPSFRKVDLEVGP